MDLKVLLSIPPDYEHDTPPLGTPALCAFLKKNRVSCSQTDLNLGYRDFLARKVCGAFPLSPEEQRFFLKPILKKFFAGQLRDRYYSGLLPGEDDDIFPYLPYDNNTNSSFHFYERLISSDYLWRYLEDADENTFLQFYKDSGILNRLREDNIKLFGISVTSPSQVIASLTLGLLVKKNLPHIHLTIGGQWVTLYRNTIIRKKELFKCFDSAIVFEGESALFQLAKTLERENSIVAIPNIILRDVVQDADPGKIEENMDLLPCPDFDGLNLNDYGENRSGEKAVTYETSRGCYWAKCAYCVDLPLPKPSYRRKDPGLVVNDMEELKRKYGVEYLFLSDPALSPRQMREISRCIIEKGADIKWWAFARLDPGFSRGLLDLAYTAGLRQINFGFESASDRICKLLDKGNKRERSSRIIKDCAGAGIKVGLQTMLGLPGESFEEGLDTIDFLVSHKEFISQTAFNTYYLTPFNHIHQNPVKYGIEYSPDGALPFRFFIPFKNRHGMDMDKAELLKRIFYSLAGAGAINSLRAPDPAVEERVEFRMNGDSCALRYMRNKSTGEVNLIENESAPKDGNAGHDA